MATHSIISKRPTPFLYQQWGSSNGNFVRIGNGILVNGGAGVVGGRDLLSDIPLEKRSTLVPESVITFVDDQALEYLMGVDKFKKDLERGIIQVVKGRISESEGDKIAKSDMLDNEHIPNRPFTEKDIKEAGGKINDDGSVNIEHAVENLGDSRKMNAGAPTYVKKRTLEEKRQARAEKQRAKKKV